MAEIYEIAESECHEGRTHDSIARRVWGGAAEIRNKKAEGDVWLAEIVKRDTSQPAAWFVLAHVVLR